MAPTHTLMNVTDNDSRPDSSEGSEPPDPPLEPSDTQLATSIYRDRVRHLRRLPGYQPEQTAVEAEEQLTPEERRWSKKVIGSVIGALVGEDEQKIVDDLLGVESGDELSSDDESDNEEAAKHKGKKRSRRRRAQAKQYEQAGEGEQADVHGKMKDGDKMKDDDAANYPDLGEAMRLSALEAQAVLSPIVGIGEAGPSSSSHTSPRRALIDVQSSTATTSPTAATAATLAGPEPDGVEAGATPPLQTTTEGLTSPEDATMTSTTGAIDLNRHISTLANNTAMGSDVPKATEHNAIELERMRAEATAPEAANDDPNGSSAPHPPTTTKGRPARAGTAIDTTDGSEIWYNPPVDALRHIVRRLFNIAAARTDGLQWETGGPSRQFADNEVIRWTEPTTNGQPDKKRKCRPEGMPTSLRELRSLMSIRPPVMMWGLGREARKLEWKRRQLIRAYTRRARDMRNWWEWEIMAWEGKVVWCLWYYGWAGSGTAPFANIKNFFVPNTGMPARDLPGNFVGVIGWKARVWGILTVKWGWMVAFFSLILLLATGFAVAASYWAKLAKGGCGSG